MLKDEFLAWDYFERLLNKIVESRDTDSIIIWYDLLNNKILVDNIPSLLHYYIIWESGSWKTVLLLNIIYQFLSKPFSEVVLLEKWTDSDYWFSKIWSFVYKTDVQKVKASTVITIFTRLTLEIQRRRNLFTKFKSKKVSEYNEEIIELQKEWNFDNPIIKYLYFFIDEFAAIRMAVKSLWWQEMDDMFISSLASVLNVARSFWIFIAFATQYPQANEWVDTRLVANLRTKILWKVVWATHVT